MWQTEHKNLSACINEYVFDVRKIFLDTAGEIINVDTCHEWFSARNTQSVYCFQFLNRSDWNFLYIVQFISA